MIYQIIWFDIGDISDISNIINTIFLISSILITSNDMPLSISILIFYLGTFFFCYYCTGKNSVFISTRRI